MSEDSLIHKDVTKEALIKMQGLEKFKCPNTSWLRIKNSAGQASLLVTPLTLYFSRRWTETKFSGEK